MKKIVIASACRTAIGKFGGSLTPLSAPQMGAIVIKEALNRAGVEAGTGGRSASWGTCSRQAWARTLPVRLPFLPALPVMKPLPLRSTKSAVPV